jgi:transcriptional regulator with XRE-family HTH domain
MINEHLRQHRILRNWRQHDVAKQLDISPSTLQRWERGIHHPSAYYRTKLCALFGLSSQELGLVEEPLPRQEYKDAETQQQRTDPSEDIALWTVPYTRNLHFTGREDYLDYLMQLFSATEFDELTSIHETALIQSHAIRGLGGIGKTQIAVEYAYRAHAQRRYRHTIWINGSSEEAIRGSFVALADLLPALFVNKETHQRKLVAVVIHWLEQCSQPWLLIVDNADDLLLIQSYLPRIGNGCILLTTRASAVSVFASSSMEVDNLSIEEGTNFLLQRTQRLADVSPDEMQEASRLVKVLAQFPLALDQAGAYIEETECRFSTYLQLYQEHRQALLARRGMQATNYPDTVATTWSLLLQKVIAANPATAEFLCLCAFLSPDHIPEELFTEGRTLWPPLLQQAMANSLTFNQMLEDLLAFSLIKRVTKDHLLSLHRLVQVVQIERMEPSAQRYWAEQVVRAVHAVFPDDPTDVRTWPLCRRYMEQAEVCETLILQQRLHIPEAAEILDRMGIYLFEHGQYLRAESLFMCALAIQEQVFGSKHHATARSLNNLAMLYWKRGKYEQAPD